jgi:hypothetical protein
MSLDWQTEVLKALLNVIVATITLGLGWLVGQRLTVFWAIRQKRRELELAAVNEFYGLYGEFFAIWKAWVYNISDEVQIEMPEATQWSLLKRACIAEGKLEAIFVKLSSESSLSDRDIEVLGKFRQVYQQLRESIKKNKRMEWISSSNSEYVSFKRLAYLVACIILDDRVVGRDEDALVKITSNYWEDEWEVSDDNWRELTTHYK